MYGTELTTFDQVMAVFDVIPEGGSLAKMGITAFVVKWGGNGFDLVKYSDELAAVKNFQDHHMFPQKFRSTFEKAGINIDEFTLTVESEVHLKGIHGNGLFSMPGKWNDRWADFLKVDRTKDEIIKFGNDLLKEFGLEGVTIHAYKKRKG